MNLAVRPESYRRQLHERALDQYGYVTTSDAIATGIPPIELPKLAARGGMTHVAYGVYRFDDIPRTQRDQYMEAVLRAGPGAFLVDDAVLALFDLGLVIPRRIRVGLPRRSRAKLPLTVEVVPRVDVGPDETTEYEGIPATTLRRALLDARKRVMPERLIDAVHQARARGLLRRTEATELLAEIQA